VNRRRKRNLLFRVYVTILIVSAITFYIGFFWVDSWKMAVGSLALNLTVARVLERERIRP